ncbi:probable G-protein coupled receptor Mth-like 3 [Coccinella septempunctata]|uniref:probable G-protein coupled receptor Mth-like 3 n=1 Tax=Coccinella septempunctata TaxID=41139 RepID=UPI001D08A86E|nr:probable G-protein coupled receptor Mth-like 3 [Coccinella septempunctata]
MKLSYLILIFTTSNIISSDGSLHKKCCKSDEQIVEKNADFTCETVKNSRLQDNFEVKDFLARNVTGTCVEISGKKVTTFQVKNDTKSIEKLEDLGEIFFSKCCPLDYRYNTTIHACKKEPGNSLGFLKMDSFVRVGLPECEIISDKILESQGVKMNGKDLILLKEMRILEEKYCVDSTLDGKLIVRICESDYRICSQIMCIHKCCPDGQSFINRTTCHDTFTNGIHLGSTVGVLAPDDPFVLIHGFTKPIKPMSPKKYEFGVDRFGLFTVYINKTNSFQHHEVADGRYCIEHAFRESNIKVLVDNYILFARGGKVPPIQMNILITRWLKIVSCIFLILTILVYLLLPKMRNLFGKILLCYCVATLVFFSSLTLSQFYSNDFSDATCITMGFISLLSTIWSFTWLQIMCFDIWFSFGTPRTLSGPLQQKEWKRLLQYSVYGWGFPIVWVGMIALFSFTTMMPEAMRPIIGIRRCLLENSDARPGNYSFLIYVTLPLLVQQIINTIMFVKTILYCLRIKAEIESMNDSDRRTDLNASRERLELIMKLAVIMGVFFIFETVSSMHNFQKNSFTAFIENIWDSINCLQGLYIFIIFICKRKVYYSICERIPCITNSESSTLSTETQLSMN